MAFVFRKWPFVRVRVGGGVRGGEPRLVEWLFVEVEWYLWTGSSCSSSSEAGPPPKPRGESGTVGVSDMKEMLGPWAVRKSGWRRDCKGEESARL